MERCPEHLIVDGEVDRSRKMNGVVERTRRCEKCGSLFKTFELTQDQIDRQNRDHDIEIKDLKRELDFYREGIDLVKRVWEGEDYLKEYLRYEYRFRINKGEDVDG